MAEERAARAVDGAGIAAVGAGLLAADVELGRAVERVRGGAVTLVGFEGLERFRRAAVCGVGHEALGAAFAPEAAFAHTAEGGGGVEEVGRVDPDDTGGEFRRDVEREVDVFRPEGGCEAVAGVVGQFHRLGGRAEGGGDEDGAEDFLLHQRRGGERPVMSVGG